MYSSAKRSQKRSEIKGNLIFNRLKCLINTVSSVLLVIYIS